MIRYNILLFRISFFVFLLSGNTDVNAQVVENPVFDRTDIPSFHVDKVESNNDTTYLYCSYYAEADSWANISKDIYVCDIKTNKKYHLLKCEGLPYAPERKIFSYRERCDVKLYFTSFQNTSKFDLIENPETKSFNVYGIDLNNQYKETYNETILNRLLSMSSFYDVSDDTLKSIQLKKELIEAQRYNYGRLSDVTFFSILGLCVLYDRFGFHKDVINQIQDLSVLLEETCDNCDLENAMKKKVLSENHLIANYYENVAGTIKEAINICEKYHIIDNVYAFLLRNNAIYYSTNGDEHKFIQEQKRCLDIRRKLGNEKFYLQDLLVLYIWDSNPAVYANRLKIIEEKLEDLPSFVNKCSNDYAYLLSIIALMYRMTGNPAKSIVLSDQILNILEKDSNRNTKKITEIQSERIACFRELKKWHEVIQIGEAVMQTCDSLRMKSETYKRILEDLADSYNKLFDYEKAIPIMDKLIAINEEEHDWINLATSLCFAGNYSKNKRDYNGAENYLKKALNIINSHDKPEEYLMREEESGLDSQGGPNLSFADYKDIIINAEIDIYASLGFISSDRNNYQDAIEYELKAGEYMNMLLKNKNNKEISFFGFNYLYGYHLLQLSRYYFYNEQFKESNDCAKESISFFMKGGSSQYYDSYLQLAINKCAINNIDSAIIYANEALLVSKSSKNKADESSCLASLAFIYSLMNDYSKAEEYLSEALDYLQGMIKNEIVNMTVEQKQRLWNSNEKDFLEYREIVSKCDRNKDLYSKLLDYTLFSKGLLLDTENLNEDKSIKRMEIKWKDIQKKLSCHDIAIEFFTTQDDSIHKTYHALIIDSSCEYPNMITIFSDSDYESLQHNNQEVGLELLGNLIWKPIINQYNMVKNIYFSPDGILYIKPIEYCKIDGIGELAEQYNLYRLSSIKEILIKDKTNAQKNATLYGGLDYDLLAKEISIIPEANQHSILRSISARGGFEPLYSTLEEIHKISSLLTANKVTTTLYSGNEGTEDSFKALSGKGTNILHMSTHGMYIEPDSIKNKKRKLNYDFLELIINDKDPVKEDIVLTHSFLVMSGGNKLNRREKVERGLSDGILTAYEISQVDLSKVDLVVLSACETGLGDIENGGVYGLQRGFKKAGVNTILMSLNKVDDEATKILMVEFYKNLMSRKSKHQSLKDAQKYLRQIDNGKYDKPEYWTSFIMLDGLN